MTCLRCHDDDAVQGGLCVRCEVIEERGREWWG